MKKSVDEFWKKVNKLGAKILDTPCWEWTGPKQRGYGAFKNKRAHRISWELLNGQIPAGLLACHTCDNRSCVNPGHLFVGTQKDNIRDAMKKGRLTGGHGPSGSHNGRSKLTEADVLNIRNKYTELKSTRKLAKTFGVSRSMIQFIIHRKNWTHV